MLPFTLKLPQAIAAARTSADLDHIGKLGSGWFFLFFFFHFADTLVVVVVEETKEEKNLSGRSSGGLAAALLTRRNSCTEFQTVPAVFRTTRGSSATGFRSVFSLASIHHLLCVRLLEKKLLTARVGWNRRANLAWAQVLVRVQVLD